MKSRILNSLPSSLGAGDMIEVQLSPFGEFPNTRYMEGGRREQFMQICDAAAFAAIAANFDGEVLVDYDHAAEHGLSTAAAAWVQSVRVDPERGLIGVFKFTDGGANAVAQRQFRFLSPAWTLDESNRPDRLIIENMSVLTRHDAHLRSLLLSCGG